jgi:Polyketide cyclase / dehydrase and lipid transport
MDRRPLRGQPNSGSIDLDRRRSRTSLVSDIELMPTLSNELQRVEWVDGATEPRVGARFVGYNEHDAFGRWSTTSQIIDFDAPHEFAWAVGDPDNPSAKWRFRLTPRDGGTALSFWT